MKLETVYQSIALHDTLVFYTAADDEQVSLSCDCPGLSVGGGQFSPTSSSNAEKIL